MVVGDLQKPCQVVAQCVQIAPLVTAHLLFFRVFMKDSALALSQGLPTRLMLGCSPWSASRVR